MDIAAELREQGRGMAGALLVLGISFAYTIETWWLAVEIPATRLVGFVVVGLALVVPITRQAGFRSEGEAAEAEGSEDGERGDGERGEGDERAGDEGPDDVATGEHRGSEGNGEGDDVWPDEWGPPTPSGSSPVWVESLEAVFQAFLVGYATLFLFDIVSLGDPLPVVVRTGLVQVVPLAFGAALANEFLSGEQEILSEAGFPRSLGVFAMGAVFFGAPIAPTEEVTVITEGASWTRLGAVVVATLATTYLVLYVLEFRGQGRRLEGRSLWRKLGQSCVVYAIGLLMSAGMLLALSGTGSEPFATQVRRTVVLAFPAGIGASAARVVLA
jgi:putative integral membrane protein (TIGR02587 family)